MVKKKYPSSYKDGFYLEPKYNKYTHFKTNHNEITKRTDFTTPQKR